MSHLKRENCHDLSMIISPKHFLIVILIFSRDSHKLNSIPSRFSGWIFADKWPNIPKTHQVLTETSIPESVRGPEMRFDILRKSWNPSQKRFVYRNDPYRAAVKVLDQSLLWYWRLRLLTFVTPWDGLLSRLVWICCVCSKNSRGKTIWSVLCMDLTCVGMVWKF